MSRYFLNTAVTVMIILAAGCSSKPDFVRVEDGQFIRHGEPYTYIGTNFWYGPILASEGRGGDMERLTRELDALKELGLENLRVLVGGDGPDGVYSRIEPTLQPAPGVYNDTLLVGLDRFLVELGKRDMQAVLYMNNSWEWSGGYGQYMEWATGERALIPVLDGYVEFMQQMAKYQTCYPAQELFYDHVRKIVGRTNSITGKPYSEDPAIFSWQIGNEPRCFSADPEARAGFVGWLTKSAEIIKGLDPNHMVSLGSEGLYGCEQDPKLLEQVSMIPGIDYMTIHIWPYNWQWARAESLEADLPFAMDRIGWYIDQHTGLAARLGQPIVIEEFGFPRDGFAESRESTTVCRDAIYDYVFSQVDEGKVAGANFWGWSGFAEPAHSRWERGDDYSGDPAQEAQGLNGVYITDSTIDIIKKHNEKLR